jgi:hypothetical protein
MFLYSPHLLRTCKKDKKKCNDGPCGVRTHASLDSGVYLCRIQDLYDLIRQLKTTALDHSAKDPACRSCLWLSIDVLKSKIEQGLVSQSEFSYLRYTLSGYTAPRHDHAVNKAGLGYNISLAFWHHCPLCPGAIGQPHP